ncbi:cell envelope integrity protein TolA [Thiolapillus sp.]
MLDIIRRHPLGFFLAVLMHLVLVALMVFGLDWINPPKVQQPAGQVVQARLVDTKQLAREKEQRQTEEKRQVQEKRKQEEKKKLEQQRREAERKKQMEIKRQQEQKKKQEAEKKRKEEQRKKAEAEKKRKLALEKKELEKKKKQELERKKKLEQKKRKEQEARRKAEEKKKAEAKKKAEQERKKKAEAERKRKAEAKRKAEQKAREDELQAQWAAEKDARERASVTAAIKRKVQNSWLRPPTASNADLQATVRVRLNDSGSVLLVQVLKSSGNSAFDRSVVAAVNKADPLPMPKSPTLLSEFREFTFIFRPSK